MDPLISDYLAYLRRRHAQAAYVSDMDALAGRLDIPVLQGQHSLAQAAPLDEDTPWVQVQRRSPRQQRRADTAHELVHALSEQGQYTQAIRREHASVNDTGEQALDEHLELLTEHGADALLMPDALVTELTVRYGESAAVIAHLAHETDVSLQQALRRFVFLNTAQRRTGYLLQGNYIWYALTTGWTPEWIGSRLDELAFLEAGGTLYQSSYGRTGRIAFYCET